MTQVGEINERLARTMGAANGRAPTDRQPVGGRREGAQSDASLDRELVRRERTPGAAPRLQAERASGCKEWRAGRGLTLWLRSQETATTERP